MRWAALIALPVAACAPAPPTDYFGKPFDSSVPSDVRLWVIDRQGCEHFSGEPTGDDPARDLYLAKEIQRLCPGLEERQQRLLQRNRDRPDLRALILDN